MKRKSNQPKSILAQNLRSLRIHFGYTQEMLAETLSIHRSTYTYYETGKTEPSINSLALLADIYQIKIDDLFQPYKLADKNHRPRQKAEPEPHYTNQLSAEEKRLIIKRRLNKQKRY